ncbi:MAG: hypothetical protein AVO35_00445 [Candidatus Aegiribacteria sp. MLS_C]|nr:MAG: hypothetical protein AVO35_00445 [Candidatus Aegiribacteria sp. MLS_C]
MAGQNTYEVYPFRDGQTVSIPDRSSVTSIMGSGVHGVEDLLDFFLRNEPDADPQLVVRLAGIYIEECALEGVNSDVAFVQMCLETGFLCFGGLVTEDMNNFCGLGAVGPEQPGISFPDERTGIRAHVQHLKAYASTEPLVEELVDPRFRLVQPRGKAPDIFGLAGTWAADPLYGQKMADMMADLSME